MITAVTKQNQGAPWGWVGYRNECATPWPWPSPSAKSLCQQHIAGRVSGRSPALLPNTMKKHLGYFFPFLCLPATSSMTFLVSPYCGFSTQHIVLFLVSRVIVCHFSVLALEPVSLEYAPESLVTWRGLFFISLCAGIYHPGRLEILPGAWGRSESQLGLLPEKIRWSEKQCWGLVPALEGPGEPWWWCPCTPAWPRIGTSIYCLWDLSCYGFCQPVLMD